METITLSVLPTILPLTEQLTATSLSVMGLDGNRDISQPVTTRVDNDIHGVSKPLNHVS